MKRYTAPPRQPLSGFARTCIRVFEEATGSPFNIFLVFPGHGRDLQVGLGARGSTPFHAPVAEAGELCVQLKFRCDRLWRLCEIDPSIARPLAWLLT